VREAPRAACHALRVVAAALLHRAEASAWPGLRLRGTVSFTKQARSSGGAGPGRARVGLRCVGARVRAGVDGEGRGVGGRRRARVSASASEGEGGARKGVKGRWRAAVWARARRGLGPAPPTPRHACLELHATPLWGTGLGQCPLDVSLCRGYDSVGRRVLFVCCGVCGCVL